MAEKILSCGKDFSLQKNQVNSKAVIVQKEKGSLQDGTEWQK